VSTRHGSTESRTSDVLQKASASPEGEKATSWTQPPESEPYSPQTALNGSFEPQMLACGLSVAKAPCQLLPALNVRPGRHTLTRCP
jgi:hypothetical protein